MVSHDEMILTGKNGKLKEKPISVPFSPPQILHTLTWAQTWASEVRSRQLTDLAMAWPNPHLIHKVNLFKWKRHFVPVQGQNFVQFS
jgi:hypothetical protein